MTIFDISQLSEQNPWWVDKNDIFKQFKIATLSKLTYQWNPRLRYRLNLDQDVIYTVRGPRQVGKTTLIMTIIKDLLLGKKIKPENIFYWSFENNNPEELSRILQTYLDWRLSAKEERKYLFLDEVCAIKDWARHVISFANKGSFVNCTIVVTGSHAMDMKHETELMPGRRGGGANEPLDKILPPMKFSEFVTLLWPEFNKILFDLGFVRSYDKQNKMIKLFKGEIDQTILQLSLYKKRLDILLESYLLTGGIPATINEFMKRGEIPTNLFNVYLRAIIGDLHRYGYKEASFKQITREIFQTLSNPTSWNNFTKTTEVKSHSTVQDYITAFEELYIANLCYRCSIHDGRIHTFFKKIYFQDPFIFHALQGWANGKSNYFENAKSNVLNLEIKSKLIEAIVHNHLCRFAYGLNPRDLFDPKDNICYYQDSSKKEVDFVLKFNDLYYPFEVKYQATISNSDFFAFKSFNKGVLITKDELGKYRNYVKISVSIFLLLV
ncbi:ATP-binding protein [Candidatus Woesearchaeota archaeon]|nr:ATP-binding protein [Candidatus Woesearchaeota archaeon]